MNSNGLNKKFANVWYANHQEQSIQAQPVSVLKAKSHSWVCTNTYFGNLSLSLSLSTHTHLLHLKVKLSLCLTNEALRHEGAWGSGCIDPHFLDLETGWRWAVSFTPRPLCHRGKSPRYPVDRRLGGPQSRSGRRAKEKILDRTGTRTPSFQSSSP
jgi:hypothetical protein